MNSQENKSKEPTYKILTIGDSRVGKSSIIARYVDGTYYHNLPSSIGIDYKVKRATHENQEIKLQLWDTAGQEKFRSITLNFYKNVDGIVLVFDLTDTNSFQNVPHWIRQIKLYAPENVALILLGNKSDIPEERTVFEERISEFTTEYNLKFIETSAKTGSNIDLAFGLLVKEICGKRNNPSFLPSNGEEMEIKSKKPDGIKLKSKLEKEEDFSDNSQCQC